MNDSDYIAMYQPPEHVDVYVYLRNSSLATHVHLENGIPYSG